MKGLKHILNKNSDTPLYVQLADLLTENIIAGRIADGEKLPSRRGLSEELGLSKNTVELAYQRLIEEGYAAARSRSGYFARRTSPINTDISEPDFYGTPGISYVMSQNGTDTDAVPSGALTKLCREISYDNPGLLNYGHKYGESELRRAISHNLYDLHGISCPAGRIIIGAGTDYLLQQLASVMGGDAVFGFENPCFARSYVPVKNTGAKTELINTRINAFPLDGLKNSGVTVMYASPDMQFPTARRMSAAERSGLREWAAEKPERYIIEADFDLDFAERPGRTLISQAPDKVIFLGSFYRSIAPAFSGAFVVLPDELKKSFDMRLPYYTCLKSRLEQRMIAEYLRSGKYRSHTEKLRKLYKEKRRLLKTALLESPIAPNIEIYGADSGTYFIVSVKNGMSEAELKNAAAACGVKLIPLSACLINTSEALPENSFIVGFGQLTHNQIRGAADGLIKAWG